jgi:hypothetical protein
MDLSLLVLICALQVDKMCGSFSLSHISNITKKANSTIGFLRRNLQHCPKECRKNAYISLVRSVLEYGATICTSFFSVV